MTRLRPRACRGAQGADACRGSRYRLRELREQAGLTQAQLAERIGVGQRQVSKIEHGDLDSAKVGTIRNYLEAVGGELTLEYMIGDQRMQVA